MLAHMGQSLFALGELIRRVENADNKKTLNKVLMPAGETKPKPKTVKNINIKLKLVDFSPDQILIKTN